VRRPPRPRRTQRVADTAGRRAHRRRDRRGRGLRGPLAPPGLPLSRTRAERFDDLVLDAVEDVARRHPDRLDGVDFAVEDVPDLADWERDWVPLARSYPATEGRPARVVLYRRPVEERADGERDTADLVHDVVVEELAELLGLDPDDLDPGRPPPD
jgi:predicted Zn-dependent protease with MMP-like domain